MEKKSHLNTNKETAKIATAVAQVVASTAKDLAVEVAKQSQLTMTTLALVGQDINFIKSEISEIKNNIDDKYVTRIEFTPIARTVYGMVSVILLAVIGAIMTLILRS